MTNVKSQMSNNRLRACVCVAIALSLTACNRAPHGIDAATYTKEIDQWRADVSRFGLKINYQGVGSSAGRSFYIQDSSPFVPNEVCLHITGNPVTVQVLKTDLKEVEFHDPKHHVH